MDDLVERLREHADRVAGGGPADTTYDPETLALEHEAADELERLRAAVALHAQAPEADWEDVPYCRDDGLTWPCPTARAAGVA